MIRAMVAYPTLRLEPTWYGSRYSVYWIVRGVTQHPDGRMVAQARVNRLRSVRFAWQAVRLGLHTRPDRLADLQAKLNGLPGVQLTRFTAGPDDEQENG